MTSDQLSHNLQLILFIIVFLSKDVRPMNRSCLYNCSIQVAYLYIEHQNGILNLEICSFLCYILPLTVMIDKAMHVL